MNIYPRPLRRQIEIESARNRHYLAIRRWSRDCVSDALVNTPNWHHRADLFRHVNSICEMAQRPYRPAAIYKDSLSTRQNLASIRPRLQYGWKTIRLIRPNYDWVRRLCSAFHRRASDFSANLPIPNALYCRNGFTPGHPAFRTSRYVCFDSPLGCCEVVGGGRLWWEGIRRVVGNGGSGAPPPPPVGFRADLSLPRESQRRKGWGAPLVIHNVYVAAAYFLQERCFGEFQRSMRRSARIRRR